MNPTQGNDRANGGSSADSREPIRLGNATLEKYRHVCAFFQGDDDWYRVLLPFIKEGFERGEKAFHVVNPKLREEHLRRLGSVGIDAIEMEQAGQFELLTWEEAYFREGHFNQDTMLATVQAALDEPKQRGFPLTRLVGQMEWALEDRQGVNQLLEYETRLNYISLGYRDPLICTYNLAKFSGDVVIDIMRTHPMVIIAGMLHENPFFVPPDEFLRELRDREAKRKVTPA